MSQTIYCINGPNLGLLGLRQPEIYGTQTLADIEKKFKTRIGSSKIKCIFEQSNHEGALIDICNKIFLDNHDIKNQTQQKCIGLIINPGGFSHTSIALRDALEMIQSLHIPIVEVHLSNIYSREEFRKQSYVSAIAKAIVSGMGAEGYIAALNFILSLREK